MQHKLSTIELALEELRDAIEAGPPDSTPPCEHGVKPAGEPVIEFARIAPPYLTDAIDAVRATQWVKCCGNCPADTPWGRGQKVAAIAFDALQYASAIEGLDQPVGN